MKKWFWGILVVFCLLAITIVAIGYWSQQAGIAERRQHIFCEVLKPDMDKKMVLETLKQFGNFEYSEGNWGGYSDLYGNYADRQIVGSSNLFIYFHNGKYVGTSIDIGYEHVESVCQPSK